MRMLLAFLSFALAATAIGEAELAQVQTVYLLPMSSGLDQYLANRLTALGVVQVVTDPAKADAIFTDRLGEALDRRLKELYQPPKSEAKEKESEKVGEKSWEKPLAQPYSKGRGNIFLIDRKTHNVVWSAYARPKNSSPDEVNRIAEHIAGRFQKDRKAK